MNKYYIKTKALINGTYEIHCYGCVWISNAKNIRFLGKFDDCLSAIERAKVVYPSKIINGCLMCSPYCHESI